MEESVNALPNEMNPVDTSLIIEMFEVACKGYEESVGQENVGRLDFVLMDDSHCLYKLAEMNIEWVR